MTDDKTAKDTARDPEREALGRLRGGLRAAAKKAVRKVAKKPGQRRTTKKTTAAATKTTTAAAAKTTAKAARSAKRGDKSAPAGGDAPASRTSAARTSAAKGRAAPSGTTKAASGTARAAHAAPAHEAGPSIESPRPPGPIHPGAALDSVQEHAGGLGSLLALWGPLIIVGFLVLVFRGGDEGESTVTAGADVPGRAAADAQAGVARGLQSGGDMNPAAGGGARTPPAVPSVAAQGAVEAFDGGFAMRTSMASPPVFAGGSGTGMPAVASRRLYPSPPGPYRDPRYPGLPTGESWSADSAREWMWSAEGRPGPGPEDGGDTPVQWVRCAPPYYWCPAPDSPAW